MFRELHPRYKIMYFRERNSTRQHCGLLRLLQHRRAPSVVSTSTSFRRQLQRFLASPPAAPRFKMTPGSSCVTFSSVMLQNDSGQFLRHLRQHRASKSTPGSSCCSDSSGSAKRLFFLRGRLHALQHASSFIAPMHTNPGVPF